MNDLRVTLVQTELIWEDRDANLENLSRLLTDVSGSTDLIILPEMFTTGFTLKGEKLADKMAGVTVSWLKETAVATGAAVAGSVIVCEGKRFYNRLLWAAENGDLYHYDKKHLFRYAGEDRHYSPGTEKTIMKCKGWRIRPFICYDLRFPVWSANVMKSYDLGVYVANWPRPRIHHWDVLLTARAIENQAFVAGVNRIGADGNGLEYCGHSMLVDPQGHVIHTCEDRSETVTVALRWKDLEEYRERFPAWMDM